MADGDGKTVLVTGGSGYLAGWCIIGLIERGYRVRTTVRNPAREPEVHATVASQVDPGHHLTVHQADLTSDEHWDNVIEGCDYVLHVASPFPPKQPKDPDELIVPAREGTLRVLGKALDHDVKRVVVTSSIAAIRLAKGTDQRVLTEDDWTDPDDESLTPYVRSKAIAERAAWDLVEERGARGPAGGRQSRRDHRARPERRPLVFDPGDRAAAEGNARHAEARLQLRRRSGRRGPRDQGDDGSRGRRPALHRRDRVRVDVRGRRGPPRSAGRGERRRCPRARFPTSSCGGWRCSTAESARSSAASARGRNSPPRKPGPPWAGRRARSMTRSRRRARAWSSTAWSPRPPD